MEEFFKYGEKVEGYDVRVLNEREARAGAGILLIFAILGLVNSVVLGHMIFTQFFISFFTLDFFIRVINPSFSPSLLLGRLFVKNQIPEYVGAAQKRFAWGLGLILAVPMFYMIVLHTVHNPIKLVICFVCILLLFLETAFSICVGCKMYGLIYRKKAMHCPGGSCEIEQKDPVQRFTTAQKIIVAMSTLFVIGSLYFYIVKVENKTFVMKKIAHMINNENPMPIRTRNED